MANRRCLLLFVAFLGCYRKAAAKDPHTLTCFKRGSGLYTNVTVVCESKADIFVSHAGGMANIKVRDLPAAVQQELGYAVTAIAETRTGSNAKSASAKVANAVTSTAKSWRASLMAWLGRSNVKWPGKIPNPGLKLNGPTLAAIAGGALLWHLFFSYCCHLICLKARVPTGVLVWLPILQLIPLAQAAGMSRWWFLAVPVPVLNLLGYIIWCVKIVQVRGKKFLVSLLLMLPVTSPPSFAYLSFYSGARPSSERKCTPMSMHTS